MAGQWDPAYLAFVKGKVLLVGDTKLQIAIRVKLMDKTEDQVRFLLDGLDDEGIKATLLQLVQSPAPVGLTTAAQPCPSSSAATGVDALFEVFGNSGFQTLGQSQQLRKLDKIPATSSIVADIGRYFKLCAFGGIQSQIVGAIARMNRNFEDFKERKDELDNGKTFGEKLQLLRIVSIPGLGKTTVLLEAWDAIHNNLAALEQGYKKQFGEDALVATVWQRLRNCLNPTHRLVFYHSLTGNEQLIAPFEKREDDNDARKGEKAALEEGGVGSDEQKPKKAKTAREESTPNKEHQPKQAKEEEDIEKIRRALAYRMLFSSLAHGQPTYKSFLMYLRSQNLLDIEPMDVIRLWQRMRGLSNDDHWCFVFQLDEFNAVQPQQPIPTWAQHLVSEFVKLRKDALIAYQNEEMSCMPILLFATHRAAHGDVRGTASARSEIGDICLRGLRDAEVEDLFADFFRRLQVAVEPPVMQKLLHVSKLVGGIPRNLASVICTAASSGSPTDLVLGAGGVEFMYKIEANQLDDIGDELSKELSASRWREALQTMGDGTCNPNAREELLTLVFAHDVCRVPVLRSDPVGNTGYKWQGLESDGLLLFRALQGAATHLCEGGIRFRRRTTSSSSEDEVAQQQVEEDCVSTSEFSNFGSNRDMSVIPMVPMMPPIVLCFVQRHCKFGGLPMPSVPMLDRMADWWRKRERSDVGIIVLRFFLHKQVFHNDTVLLSELLGVKLEGLDREVLVPTAYFMVAPYNEKWDAVRRLTWAEERLKDPGQWAFLAGGNHAVDSFLILQTVTAEGTLRKFFVFIQSKVRTQTLGKQLADYVKPEDIEGAYGAWQYATVQQHLEALQADHITLFVTDQPYKEADQSRIEKACQQMNAVLYAADDDAQLYGYAAHLVKRFLKSR